jgi:hypothetical protein
MIIVGAIHEILEFALRILQAVFRAIKYILLPKKISDDVKIKVNFKSKIHTEVIEKKGNGLFRRKVKQTNPKLQLNQMLSNKKINQVIDKSG